MRPIDTLREKIDLWKKSTTDTALMSVLHEVLQQIDVAIYEMDHQEAASPWRRVEDQLPEPCQDVLVYTYFYGRSIYAVAWLDNEGKWSFGTVTHWMPIEPPKEETK